VLCTQVEYLKCYLSVTEKSHYVLLTACDHDQCVMSVRFISGTCWTRQLSWVWRPIPPSNCNGVAVTLLPRFKCQKRGRRLSQQALKQTGLRLKEKRKNANQLTN